MAKLLACKCNWTGTTEAAGYDEYDDEYRCPDCGSGADHLKFAAPKEPVTTPRNILMLFLPASPHISVGFWHGAKGRTYRDPSAHSLDRLARAVFRARACGRATIVPAMIHPGWYAEIT